MIIGEYHGSQAAIDSEERWQMEISLKGLPRDIPTARLRLADIPSDELVRPDGVHPVLNAAKLLVLSGLCKTTSEARRVIREGGAYFDEAKLPIAFPATEIRLETGKLLWVGKKRVVRLEVEE
jgi:tyrosyl-tRNA synthetase